MKVINIFGGPGSGKSTFAAGLFYYMKVHGYNVEMAPEYAKDMVYEHRGNILNDQLYILAKQNRRLRRLEDNNVDYAICDSPLVLSAIYEEYHHGEWSNFTNLAIDVFKKYNNINLYLKRRAGMEYSKQGRLEDQDEAMEIDKWQTEFLECYGFEYSVIENGLSTEQCFKKYVLKLQ